MKDYTFTKNWFDRHESQWRKTLVSELGNRKINVLEIGVFEGKATVWILDNLFTNPDSKIIAIDNFETIYENLDNESTFHKNIEESGKESQVEVIKVNSFDELIKLNNEKKKIFDFIYVDGSHSAPDVLSDAILSWNLLKEDGIMILNNYEWDYFVEEYNNPRIAIDSFLKIHQCQIDIIYKSFQVAIRKKTKEVTRTKREDNIFFKILSFLFRT